MGKLKINFCIFIVQNKLWNKTPELKNWQGHLPLLCLSRHRNDKYHMYNWFSFHFIVILFLLHLCIHINSCIYINHITHSQKCCFACAWVLKYIHSFIQEHCKSRAWWISVQPNYQSFQILQIQGIQCQPVADENCKASLIEEIRCRFFLLSLIEFCPKERAQEHKTLHCL